MKHEWVHTGISAHDGVEGTAEIICIACKMTASFLRSTRAEDNVPGDPRNRTDCRGVAWHERNRKASRERLKRLREQGLCQACGIRPRVNETRCETCRDEHAEGGRLRKSVERHSDVIPGTNGVTSEGLTNEEIATIAIQINAETK
jgi:hypothetical protein